MKFETFSTFSCNVSRFIYEQQAIFKVFTNLEISFWSKDDGIRKYFYFKSIKGTLGSIPFVITRETEGET